MSETDYQTIQKTDLHIALLGLIEDHYVRDDDFYVTGAVLAIDSYIDFKIREAVEGIYKTLGVESQNPLD